MKHILTLLFALTVVAGYSQHTTSDQRKTLIADISDLEMSEDIQNMFSARRNNLMNQVDTGIVIIRSFSLDYGGRHEYRTANNFYYLTGFSEPYSVIVLNQDTPYPFTMYIQKREIKETIYNGESPGVKEIMDMFRPDTVKYYKVIDEIIADQAYNGKPVFIDYADTQLYEKLSNALKTNGLSLKQILDVASFLSEMRVYKDNSEIARIHKSIDITGEAFINACLSCRPGMYEFETEAMIEYTYRRLGSPMPFFGSIIGSGPNSVILHYEKNNRMMLDGDLLLVDIGAEYGYYGADITRTIPVNGKYTREQKEIYDLVLQAQKAAIAEMIPGNYIVAGQNRCHEIITRGLFRLGLITDQEKEWQKKFYMLYPISHYIGMDVHDAGNYGAPDSIFRQNIAKDTLYGRVLEKGMVLTVEPGLYFRPEGLSQLNELFKKEATPEEIQSFIDTVTPLYEKYINIGVRIEDDILITDDGNKVLTKTIPKEIDDIERIMSKRNQ